MIATKTRPLAESIDRITASRFGRLRQISRDHSFPLRSVLASSVIAASLAPKSTVPCVNCFTPAPEPTDW